jgi:hypothetical protein
LIFRFKFPVLFFSSNFIESVSSYWSAFHENCRGKGVQIDEESLEKNKEKLQDYERDKLVWIKQNKQITYRNGSVRAGFTLQSNDVLLMTIYDPNHSVRYIDYFEDNRDISCC